jgi:molybdopterin-containing oxidoreductase family membrane subunit
MASFKNYYGLTPFTRSSLVFLMLLLVPIGLSVWGWITQLEMGLGVTGLNRPVAWGLYMANFVFYISVSMSGTFISATIRLL